MENSKSKCAWNPADGSALGRAKKPQVADDSRRAKPILVIEWPQDQLDDQSDGVDMAGQIMDRTRHMRSDYFILLIGVTGLKRHNIKVYFEKDFNEVKYEELKAIVSEAANKKRKKNALPELQKD